MRYTKKCNSELLRRRHTKAEKKLDKNFQTAIASEDKAKLIKVAVLP